MAGLTAPFSGAGSTLGYKLSGGSAFTTLTQLKDDCEFDGFDAAEILTNLLASSVVTRTPGRLDYGKLTGSVYLSLSDATVAELFTLFAARTVCQWQLQLPDSTVTGDGATFVFSGYVDSLKPGNITGEDAPTADFSIAISGSVTVTAAT